MKFQITRRRLWSLLQLYRRKLWQFVPFAWRRFLDDKCFETASALSYTTLVSMVPLTVAVLAIFSAFPVFAPWRDTLINFVFNNVPAAGQAVKDTLLGLASNANQLTGISLLVLLFSALSMMVSIEDRLNSIWRVREPRDWISRLLLYWAALTLGPVLLVGSLAAMSYAVALPLLHHAADHLLVQEEQRLLGLLPSAVTFASLWLLYAVVPNRRIGKRYTLIGALLGTVLFGLGRAGFGLYVEHAHTYQKIYGALAALPIFLLWIYLSWIIVVLGASITASISDFEYNPEGSLLPKGAEFLGLLIVLEHFVAAQRHCQNLTIEAVNRAESSLSRHDVTGYFDDLHRAGIIHPTDHGDWAMICSLDTMRLSEIYRQVHYRLPLNPLQEAEQRGVKLSPQLSELLATLAGHLKRALAANLEQVYPLGQERSPAAHPKSQASHP